MKKTKLNSTKQVISEKQKISSFFKKLSKEKEAVPKSICLADQEKKDQNDIIIRNGSTSLLNLKNETTAQKRKYESSDCENCFESKSVNTGSEGCVKYPPSKRILHEASTESEQNLKIKSPFKNSPFKSHHIKSNENTSQTPNKSTVNMYFATLSKTPPKLKLQKTPIKSKSPAKLYSKSPKKVQGFNVELLTNFVKITPSKSNEYVPNKTTLKEDENGRKHLNLDHNHLSPSNINTRYFEVQQKNEKTPTKTNGENVSIILPSSSAKIKLNFDEMDSSNLIKKDREKERVNCKVDKTDEALECHELANLILSEDWGRSPNKEEKENYTLNLCEGQYCRVLGITNSSRETEVVVQSVKDAQKALCIFRGFWLNLKINIGDVLYITACYDKTNSFWFVDNSQGLVVYEPDYLISSTSVVGSLFCKRKAVFSERFRGFDSSNKFMVIGSLVHRALQDALKNNIYTIKGIQQNIQKMITSKEMMYMLYASSMKPSEIEDEMSEYGSRIHSFINRYLKIPKNNENTKSLNNFSVKENWVGKIDDIQDIEENIWSPELGLKGKIDVTVKSGLTAMPLELKTGRASVSLEHRGQVMLYIMMMSKLGYNVSSGLLLYLKEEVLREIPLNQNEKRDLMLLRNELAYYLTRGPNKNESNGSSDMIAELPAPINHHSACGKCPYNNICCAFLKYENVNLNNYKHLQEVKSSVLSHLDPSHIEYFIKWTYLLQLEGLACSKNKTVKDIYTVSPEERGKKGGCIIDLKVKEVVYDCNGLYKTSFEKERSRDEVSSFLTSDIGEGNYVIVSVKLRPAVAAGFVSLVETDTIIVDLDRDLNKHYANQNFYLDTYKSSSSQTFNMSSLALLLDNTDRAKKLRELIVNKKLPTFKTKLPKQVATKGAPILRNLNKIQQRAVLKAVAANDFLLIKGMPGTGKTATIVALIQLLVELEQTVLITSHTHSAVDNVCIRLIEKGIPVLRLGSESRIHKKLHDFSEHTLTKACKSVEELEQVYQNAKIVAVTCFGSDHPALNRRVFNICIIDESSQIIQCSSFRALFAAEKFVLVGDPDQLPPVVKNREAIEKGLSESLFERLQHPETMIKLTHNYRMNSRITEFANILTYEGELIVANDNIGNAHLNLPNKEECIKHCEDQWWLVNAVDDSLTMSFQALDTGHTYTINQEIISFSKLKISLFGDNEELNCINLFEAATVVQIVNAFIKAGVAVNSIGIITPYCRQASILLKTLQHTGIEVSTVDQFQGRDKEIIIYSCTKSFDPTKQIEIGKFDILQDKRRLTVAITRAKHKFIIIGDIKAVLHYTPFKKLLDHLPEENFIRLKNGDRDFLLKFVKDFVNECLE